MCGRVREKCLSTLGLRMVRCTPALCFGLFVFAAICERFKETLILMLYAKVLGSFQSIAMRKGFKEIFKICCFTFMISRFSENVKDFLKPSFLILEPPMHLS